MIRITHPEPAAGEVQNSGLTFIDGVAEVESISDEAREVLTAHGFTFDGAPAKAKAAKNVTAEPVADEVEITDENAGVVVDADGVEHVGELPAAPAPKPAGKRK